MEFDKNLIPLLPISGVLFLFFLGPGITFVTALTGRFYRIKSYNLSNVQQIIGILLASTIFFTASFAFLEIFMDVNLMIREVVYLLGSEEITDNDLYSETLENVGVFYSKLYLVINFIALILGLLISLVAGRIFRNELYNYFRGSYIGKENKKLRKKDIDYIKLNVISRVSENEVYEYDGILKNYEFDSRGNLQRIYLANATQKELGGQAVDLEDVSFTGENTNGKSLKGMLIIPYHSILNINLRYFIKKKKLEKLK